jgi:20S proteasome alpha/beta subunit
MISLLVLLCFQLSSGKFDPYVDNGGTLVGLAGKGYCILASDTRLSDSYVIKSRNISRIYEVSDGLLLSASGCLSDTLELIKILTRNARVYEWDSKRSLSIYGLSYLLSYILYQRRNFPYFSFCVVGGLDDQGHGALYRYDAVGSFERVQAVCAGKGEKLIQPLLDEITDMEADEDLDSLWSFSSAEDSFISKEYSSKNDGETDKKVLNIFDNMVSENEKMKTNSIKSELALRKGDMSLERACNLIKKVFSAAAEREISIGIQHVYLLVVYMYTIIIFVTVISV